MQIRKFKPKICLLYTSDAADEARSVDLGGRRLIKIKNNSNLHSIYHMSITQVELHSTARSAQREGKG
ncbi:hypothetical protein PVA38_12075 [Streptococcus pneumoniae D39]|nr:hypothetical protein PVA38_12075 [Streptococcus pneumoniae D39]